MATAGVEGAPVRAPRRGKAPAEPSLPYLETWQAQLATEQLQRELTAAAAEAAKAATAEGRDAALQQERAEEAARARWAERVQAHLQGAKGVEEVCRPLVSQPFRPAH